MHGPEEHFLTAETEGSHEAVKIKNEIQLALMQKFFGVEKIELEQWDQWIQTYSERFQQIFDRMIKSDPHFLKHHLETPNATADLFEEELYEIK